MQQLDLLSYAPTPEEMREPEPEAEKAIAPVALTAPPSHLLDWLNRKLSHRTGLMNRYLSNGIKAKEQGDTTLQPMRRRLITQLADERSLILSQIKELENS